MWLNVIDITNKTLDLATVMTAVYVEELLYFCYVQTGLFPCNEVSSAATICAVS